MSLLIPPDLNLYSGIVTDVVADIKALGTFVLLHTIERVPLLSSEYIRKALIIRTGFKKK
jgi:hypothetical protein